MKLEKEILDVIIIGGSFAGLSAAMTLGRSLRNVLIIDANESCNRFALEAHNFITQDGVPPNKIRAVALDQVLSYPTVSLLNDFVQNISIEEQYFHIETLAKKQFISKKLIIATGLKDVLPEKDGFLDCWGKSIVHCPYCHGYESRNQITGILSNGEDTIDFIKVIKNWSSEIILFTEGTPRFDLSMRPFSYIKYYTPIVEKAIHIEGKIQGLKLENGDYIRIETLYFRPSFQQHLNFKSMLGINYTDAGHIEVNHQQETNLNGVYAIGDCTTPFRSISIATAQGTMAGALVNHKLISEIRYTA